MRLLYHFGWDNFHRGNPTENRDNALLVGRVISIKGLKYIIIGEQGEIESELSGKLMYGTEGEQLPKVGDWVLYRQYESLGYVIDVLPRKNALSRKVPGRQTGRQVLATNIDCALVVQGLDHDFNIMRLDRYLVQLAACNISAVVVLNKVDLVTDPDYYRNEIGRLKRDCAVYFCSTLTGSGLHELRSTLQTSKTYVLIGSSGVGKSSLINALMDRESQKVSGLSHSTTKGKHTTTTRDLFLLPNGSLMIDTPGMREFGLTSEEGQTSESMFPGVQQFIASCRFTDCKHINESGCGVLEAVRSGALDSKMYEGYIKLVKEQHRFEITAEEKKRLGKQWGKMTKEAKNHRRKYKY